MTDEQMLEAEALLDELKDVEPMTRQEVCDYFRIELADFPRFAVAKLERELEMNRTFRRLYCDHKDSGELMRQIDQRIPVIQRSIRYWAGKAQREAREARD